MNDEDKDLSARKSQCWRCQFGMCLDEIQRQTLMHQGIDGLEQEIDIFETDNESWKEESGPSDIIHQVESTRSGAICYWGAMNVDPSQPPIRVEFVTNCSRFRKNTYVE